MLLIAGFFISAVLTYEILITGLGPPIDFLLFALFSGAVLSFHIVTFKWIRRRSKKYKLSSVRYNNTLYTRQEMKQMPVEVRRKHAYNNALAALLLSIFTIPLFIIPILGVFTLGFAFAAFAFLIKGIILNIKSLYNQRKNFSIYCAI